MRSITMRANITRANSLHRNFIRSVFSFLILLSLFGEVTWASNAAARKLDGVHKKNIVSAAAQLLTRVALHSAGPDEPASLEEYSPAGIVSLINVTVRTRDFNSELSAFNLLHELILPHWLTVEARSNNFVQRFVRSNDIRTGPEVAQRSLVRLEKDLSAVLLLLDIQTKLAGESHVSRFFNAKTILDFNRALKTTMRRFYQNASKNLADSKRYAPNKTRELIGNFGLALFAVEAQLRQMPTPNLLSTVIVLQRANIRNALNSMGLGVRRLRTNQPEREFAAYTMDLEFFMQQFNSRAIKLRYSSFSRNCGQIITSAAKSYFKGEPTSSRK